MTSTTVSQSGIAHLLAGVACVPITPASPQWLDGYGSRTARSEGAYQEISARALALEWGNSRALVLTAEVLGFDRDRVGPLKQRIAAATGLAPSRIVLSASHTHCAPRVCDMVMPGSVDAEYVTWFEGRCEAVAVQALASLRPVTVMISRGSDPGVGINRRFPSGEGVTMRPNPAGPHDRDLDTLWFTEEGSEGALLASLTIVACHPTCRGGQLIGGDYPGFLCRELEKACGHVALFALGCAGDVRPHVRNEQGGFSMAELAEVETAGKTLAAAVLASRAQGFAAPVRRLEVRRAVFPAPLVRHSDWKQLGRAAQEDANPLRRAWGEWLLSAGEPEQSVPFEVQVLCFAPALVVVFWPGEVVADYALWIKQAAGGAAGWGALADPAGEGAPFVPAPHQPRVMVAAYANGAVGYVPSRAIYPLGGYEVNGSHFYYRLPAAYQPEVEDCLRETTLQLLREQA